MPYLTPVVMTLACYGYGFALLRLARYDPPSALQRVAFAFALGVGALGWTSFFFGVTGNLGSAALWLLLIPGLVPLWMLRRGPPRLQVDRLSLISWVLLALLTVSLTIDLAEALAPAADVDTMAYHFAIPKGFIAEGRVEFLPVAAEGAIPLLTHMTYAVA